MTGWLMFFGNHQDMTGYDDYISVDGIGIQYTSI